MRDEDQRTLDQLCAAADFMISHRMHPYERWDAHSLRLALDHALDYLARQLRQRPDRDAYDFLLQDIAQRLELERMTSVTADHLQWRINRIGDLRGVLER